MTCSVHFNIPSEGSISQLWDYSPNGRFLVQETFPKTLPWFVLNLIYRSTEHQRIQAFCVTAADWSTITLHDSASKQRWFDYHNQHESGLLGVATCGELPKFSETVAERSTGVPLLSAAESTLGHVRG